ncbi:MAG: glycosyl transferase family 28 [Pedobacter sp.]|nr:MAG: glycosyl transferase family 28 [Pedobacter sp.]
MIFITIGTQEPFDRLIQAMDEMAAEMPHIEFIAQTMKGVYVPKHMKCYDFLLPSQFDDYFENAELIVSHAGMGTIISALVKERPIIVIPRLLANKEHRSDHQIATARAIAGLGYVNVAYDITELKNKLKTLIQEPKVLHKLERFASEELIEDLKTFIKTPKK